VVLLVYCFFDAASSPCHDDREGSSLNSMHIDKDLKDDVCSYRNYT